MFDGLSDGDKLIDLRVRGASRRANRTAHVCAHHQLQQAITVATLPPYQYNTNVGRAAAAVRDRLSIGARNSSSAVVGCPPVPVALDTSSSIEP